MSANFINREAISQSLCLLGTVCGMMGDDHPSLGGPGDHYAMQYLLYNLAKEIFPENFEPAPEQGEEGVRMNLVHLCRGYFPESAPIPHPVHPGEGGKGP